MNKKLSIMGIIILALALFVIADDGDITQDPLNITVNSLGITNAFVTVNASTNVTNAALSIPNLPVGVELISSELFNLTENIPTDITFELNITNLATPEVTEHTLLINNGTYETSTLINLTINEIDTFHVDYSDFSSNLVDTPGDSLSGNITITNTGNIPQNFTISATAIEDEYDGDITLTLNDSGLMNLVIPGETVNIPFNYAIYESILIFDDEGMGYNLIVSNNNTEKDQIFDFKSEIENELIKVFDFDLDKTNYEPGDEVSLDLDFENLIEREFEDLMIYVSIENVEGSTDLDDELDQGFFSWNDELEDEQFNFDLPYNIDETEFDIYVKITGKLQDSEDEDDFNSFDTINILFRNVVEIDKDGDEAHIEFDNSYINTSTEEIVQISGVIINTGSRTLQDLSLIMKLNNFELSDHELNISDLRTNSNSNREEDFLYTFQIPENLTSGTYTISFELKDDGDYVHLTGNDLILQIDGIEEEQEDPEDDTPEPTPTPDSGNGWSLVTGWGYISDSLQSSDAFATIFWILGDIVLIIVAIHFVRKIIKG
jgi:hypothetical protein